MRALTSRVMRERVEGVMTKLNVRRFAHKAPASADDEDEEEEEVEEEEDEEEEEGEGEGSTLTLRDLQQVLMYYVRPMI